MKKNYPFTEDYDDYINSASSQDCTGLIPANPKPVDDLEHDSYQDLVQYEVSSSEIRNASKNPPKVDAEESKNKPLI